MIHYRFTKDARILFVGINPHYGSDRRGVPFSNNKTFWYLLSDAGLILEGRDDLRDDAGLRRFYDRKFAGKYGLNIINIVDRPSVTASDLKEGEEKYGNRRLRRIVKEYSPAVVCFVGKVTFQKFSGTKNPKFGWNGKLFRSRVYVMHFPIRGKASIRVKELKTVAKNV